MKCSHPPCGRTILPTESCWRDHKGKIFCNNCYHPDHAPQVAVKRG